MENTSPLAIASTFCERLMKYLKLECWALVWVFKLLRLFGHSYFIFVMCSSFVITANTNFKYQVKIMQTSLFRGSSCSAEHMEHTGTSILLLLILYRRYTWYWSLKRVPCRLPTSFVFCLIKNLVQIYVIHTIYIIVVLIKNTIKP